MVRMDVRDDDGGERLRVDAGASELLDRAPAAVDQHGARGHDDDDRRRVTDGRRDRPRRAQKREVHQGDPRLAGSKRASAGFVLSATERTVSSTRSLPSTKTSWRYGKYSPPARGRCSESVRSSSLAPFGSRSRVTMRT